TNTWAPKAAMPTARFGLGVAAANNGKIYAVGGNTSTTDLTTVEEYDPLTNAWTNCGTPAPGNGCHSMPTARRQLAVAAAGNGKLYAIGGLAGSGSNPLGLATVEEYDPATNTWASKTAMPTARFSLGVAADNGKIYAVGGAGPGGFSIATVEEYSDPG